MVFGEYRSRSLSNKTGSAPYINYIHPLHGTRYFININSFQYHFYMKNALVFSAMLCAHLLSAQPGPIDVYNKAVQWMNTAIDDKFAYTIAVVHHPEPVNLLRVAKKADATFRSTQDSLQHLALMSPLFAEHLEALAKCTEKMAADFDYPALQKTLEGKTSLSPRARLAQLKARETADNNGHLDQLYDNICKRFVRQYDLKLLPADTAKEYQRMQMNRAIGYAGRLSILTLEATILLNEYTDAFNAGSSDTMVLLHRECLAKLPGLLSQAQKTPAFNPTETALAEKARSLIGFCNVFSREQMPAHIGLQKKYQSTTGNNEDIQRMNEITNLLGDKYLPRVDAFQAEKMAFLRRYVPEKPEQ